ncbi:MAG: response regulator [Halorhodospira halophila]|uniref:response regulator transcription factor n=1 Tax=Halorhodospira TaxID=85108 RepID=UPI001914061D|nr:MULTISPECIES: response regulator [Halorhodospira]MBK5937309.1 two-component system response regulator [Halorhodospira halophila]MBK5944214.1 two-component system response regulator [Halorhodospira halophila]MCC3751260.1 response regulator [Halorhodospira halophila]MCG5527667.1 response regulator [Halorhodospira halophila]MCG5532684.1 response regulator [Halorhodospira sp. 9621]
MSQEILIVDDEDNIVLSLEFLMKQAGFEVRTAQDGEQALEALEARIPDLVLLDVMMPRKDGYEVCQEIRQRAEWAHLPVVMLTAKGRDVEREKGLAMGADDYITKPFSTQEVVETVQHILANGAQ